MGNLADETRWLDATAQAELVRSGQVTAAELAEAAAERIERLDTATNAVNLRWFDRAIDQAGRGDLCDGPFRGVPFLLKDLWAYRAGYPVTNGNKALKEAGYVADSTTWLVDRFEAAGFTTLGRTASPAFGRVKPSRWNW